VYVEVALPRSAPEPLTYRASDELLSFLCPGVRVRVPLRRRQVTGVVVSLSPTTELDEDAIRPVTEVLDTEPPLPPHLLHLARFLASYYRSPLGDALAAMLPARLLRADAETASLTPAGAATEPPSLPRAQAAVLEQLQASHRALVTTVLARAGVRSRAPLDILVEAGLVRTTSRAATVRRTSRWPPSAWWTRLSTRCSTPSAAPVSNGPWWSGWQPPADRPSSARCAPRWAAPLASSGLSRSAAMSSASPSCRAADHAGHSTAGTGATP